MNQRLSKHFTLHELCKSETAIRKGIMNVTEDPAIIERIRRVCENILEPVRDHYGIPFSPNSGFRSQELNAALPGSKNSQHCKGEAVDFEIPGVGTFDLAVWCEANLHWDQLILEMYERGAPSSKWINASGWVHCSYKSDGNRHEVLTYTTDRKYINGLVV